MRRELWYKLNVVAATERAARSERERKMNKRIDQEEGERLREEWVRGSW